MTQEIDIYGVGDIQFRKEVNARFAEPVKLPTSAVADLATDYPPEDWEGCAVYLSDGASDQYMAVSNGTAWFYPDGTPV